MLKVDGCTGAPVELKDGTTLDPVKYGDEKDFSEEFSERCHDCNCKVGEYHHPSCDMERCPKCDGQLITCGCMEDD